jgi:hypothetical protein
MTSIDAVTIAAQSDYASDPTFSLYADPGSIPVGHWNAGILSLQQPDGDRRRRPCSDVDEAVREAMLTWNTVEGFATLERWIGVRRAAATWTGDRRHEWQEPKQLVALVKATIRQAVKDGILPTPNDYRVTYRKSENAIYIRTHHVTLGDFHIDVIVDPLLRPFNASTAGDYDGEVIENWDFGIQAEAPTEPLLSRYLASMERAGFPPDDVDYAHRLLAIFATAA